MMVSQVCTCCPGTEAAKRLTALVCLMGHLLLSVELVYSTGYFSTYGPSEK